MRDLVEQLRGVTDFDAEIARQKAVTEELKRQIREGGPLTLLDEFEQEIGYSFALEMHKRLYPRQLCQKSIDLAADSHGRMQSSTYCMLPKGHKGDCPK